MQRYKSFKLGKIGLMVNLHADDLSSTNEDRQNSVTWPSDPVERILVQYTMPSFLVKSRDDVFHCSETRPIESEPHRENVQHNLSLATRMVTTVSTGAWMIL
jgi:hypothetical protein